MRKLNNISIEPNISPDIDLLPLIGETAWHSVTLDPSISDVSQAHYEQLVTDLKTCGALRSKMKILEVGAYAHVTGYLFAENYHSDFTLFDISAATLRMGRDLAIELGLSLRNVRRVAGDFHALPFDNGEFDVVYIASALHHTWRWRQVLAELVRVTKIGGHLILENEPCRREFCFYRFRTNRQEDPTAEEAFLDRHGLIRTVAEPYLGSRPEQLFGMTENQEIRLADLLGQLSLSSDLVHLQASPEICMGKLEKSIDKILSSKMEDDRLEVIGNLIRTTFDVARNEILQLNLLDPLVLPDAAHVNAMVMRIGELLGNTVYGKGEVMAAASGVNNPVSKENLALSIKPMLEANANLGKDLDRASIFGAGIKVIACKQRDSSVDSTKHLEATVDDDVDIMFEPGIFQIMNPRNLQFPQMQRAPIEEIVSALGADWSVTVQHNVVRVATAAVVRPCIITDVFHSEHIVVSVRVFGVVGAQSWTLWLLVDGERRSSLLFEKSGSGLLVASVSNAVGPIRIEFEAEGTDKSEVPKFNISHLGLLKVPS